MDTPASTLFRLSITGLDNIFRAFYAKTVPIFNHYATYVLQKKHSFPLACLDVGSHLSIAKILNRLTGHALELASRTLTTRHFMILEKL